MDEKTPMRVVFGMVEGEPIAFLLDAPANPGFVLSYMTVGQHAEASEEFFYHCKLAKPKQYVDLLNELEKIGYEVKDITSWMK
jgi:hypothetical protein